MNMDCDQARAFVGNLPEGASVHVEVAAPEAAIDYNSTYTDRVSREAALELIDNVEGGDGRERFAITPYGQPDVCMALVIDEGAV